MTTFQLATFEFIHISNSNVFRIKSSTMPPSDCNADDQVWLSVSNWVIIMLWRLVGFFFVEKFLFLTRVEHASSSMLINYPKMISIFSFLSSLIIKLFHKMPHRKPLPLEFTLKYQEPDITEPLNLILIVISKIEKFHYGSSIKMDVPILLLNLYLHLYI